MYMEVDTKSLRAVADKESSVYDNLSSMHAELERIKNNLSRDLVGSAGNNIIRSVKSVKGSLSASKNKLGKMSSVIKQSAERYDNCEKKVTEYDCEPVVDKYDNPDILKIAIENIGTDFSNAVDAQKAINKFLKDDNVTINVGGVPIVLNKTNKNILKTLFKKITKGTKYENLSSAYKIWSKMADGKWEKAFTEAIKTVGGEKLDIFQEGKGLNWNALKIRAVLDTFEKVMDDEGYIQRYSDYYEQKELDAAKNMDYLGVVTAMGESFVQTVGKGSVDVLCCSISETIDSFVKKTTGGWLTLSSINDAMYDMWGWSPGHLFNDVTKSISKGFDKLMGYSTNKGGTR